MLSIPHLIIIFIVALVVFGPEKLPELARNLGKVMAEFRRATGDLRSTFEGHMRDLEREADTRRIGGSTSGSGSGSVSAQVERWHNNRHSVACGRFGGWHGSDSAPTVGRAHRRPASGAHGSRASRPRSAVPTAADCTGPFVRRIRRRKRAPFRDTHRWRHPPCLTPIRRSAPRKKPVAECRFSSTW